MYLIKDFRFFSDIMDDIINGNPPILTIFLFLILLPDLAGIIAIFIIFYRNIKSINNVQIVNVKRSFFEHI